MVELLHYVPHGFVELWERAGWERTEALTGTHHGDYSVLMKAGPNCKFDPTNPKLKFNKETGEPLLRSSQKKMTA